MTRDGSVQAGARDRDAPRDAIVGSRPASPLAGAPDLVGAPDLDGRTVAERLLVDLEPPEGPLWLVIDDLHELLEVNLAIVKLMLAQRRGDLPAVAGEARRPSAAAGAAGAAPPGRCPDARQPASSRGEQMRLPEPLSASEARILRFLPTNLSGPEIAGRLSVSVNTVRTHTRHLYQKLGAHSRTEAVEQARTLGLLAPAARMP